jgi:hypothetical protein
MLNEKPNNNFYWKDKLQELESLPGEIFNKEASWERLHTRLQSKPKNKKLIWYWAAAACLLIAILSPWFLSNKKQNDFVKNNSVKNIIHTSPSQLLPVANKDTLAHISSSLIEKKLNVYFVEKDKIISSFDRKGLRSKIVAAKNDKAEFIKPEIINNAITPVDTRINIMAIVHEKKKLRVVHINELGDPVEELPVMAHNSEIHSFQLRLANQEVYVNPSTASGKTGFNILPIKNSPY